MSTSLIRNYTEQEKARWLDLADVLDSGAYPQGKGSLAQGDPKETGPLFGEALTVAQALRYGWDLAVAEYYGMDKTR